MNRKRIIAFLLTFVMLLGMMPAASAIPITDDEEGTKINIQMKAAEGTSIPANTEINFTIACDVVTEADSDRIAVTYNNETVGHTVSGNSLTFTVQNTADITSENPDYDILVSFPDTYMSSTVDVSAEADGYSVAAASGSIAMNTPPIDVIFTAVSGTTYTVCYEDVRDKLIDTVVNVAAGESITLPTLTANYDEYIGFLGWKVNNEGELLSGGSSYTPESDVELHAQWEPLGYLDSQLTVYNSSGEVHDTPREGDQFDVTFTLKNAASELLNGNFHAEVVSAGEQTTGDYEFENGTYTFTLELGKSNTDMPRVLLYGLPDGTQYTVEVTKVYYNEENSITDESLGYCCMDDSSKHEGALNLDASISAEVKFNYSFYQEYTVQYALGVDSDGDPAHVSGMMDDGSTGYEPSHAIDSDYAVYAVGVESNFGDFVSLYDSDEDTRGIQNTNGDDFLGWYMNGDTTRIYSFNESVKINEDTTFTAAWAAHGDAPTYTITMKPGYYETVDENGYSVRKWIEGNEVEVAQGIHYGETVSVESYTDHFETPANMAIQEFTTETYNRDGELIHSGTASDDTYLGDNATVEVFGDVVIYVEYSHFFDITLDFGGGDTKVVEKHANGTICSELYENWRNEERDGKVHTGWYLDYDQDNEYSDGDRLLCTRFEDSLGAFVSEADVFNVNYTIDALWQNGFSILYKDTAGENTYEYADIHLDENGPVTHTVSDPWDIFSHMDSWDHTGYGFANWTDSDDNTYDVDDVITTDESITLTAVWDELKYYLTLQDEVTLDDYAGAGGNNVTVYADDENYVLAADYMDDGGIWSEEPGYYWTITPVDNPEDKSERYDVSENVGSYDLAELRNNESGYTAYTITVDAFDMSADDPLGTIETEGRVAVHVTLSSEYRNGEGEEPGDDEPVGDAYWKLVRLGEGNVEELVAEVPDDGSYTISANTDLVLIPVGVGATPSWDVYGYDEYDDEVYDNGYSGKHHSELVGTENHCGDFWLCRADTPEGESLSLQELMQHMRENEHEVVYFDFDNVGGLSLTLNVSPYDYEAAIEASEGETPIDLSDYTFKSDSKVTFSAVLDPENEDASWSWNVVGGEDYDFETEDGETVDRLVQATLSTEEIYALDSDRSNWTVKVYAVDAEGAQISNEVEFSFEILYEGPFQLGIDHSWLEGEFDYVKDASNTPVDLSEVADDGDVPVLYARYRGIHEDESFNIEEHDPTWTIVPLNESNQPISGVAPIAVNGGGSTWEDWDSWYIDAGKIQDAVASTDYAGYENWLLQLSIDDGAYTAEVNVRADVRYSITLTAQKGEATFDLDTIFRHSQSTSAENTITFTPVVTPKADVDHYRFYAMGETNGEDLVKDGGSITLYELLSVDPDETTWNMSVIAKDSPEGDTGIVGDTFTIHVTAYDYTAEISVMDANEDGDTVVTGSYEFASNVDYYLSAELVEEGYPGKVSWSWDVYGNDTETDFSFDGEDRKAAPTFPIIDLEKLSPRESNWTISAYAVDGETGKQISTETSVDVNTRYHGDFRVAIDRNSVPGNYDWIDETPEVDKNKDDEAYYARYLRNAFTQEEEAYQPQWTVYPTDSDYNRISDGEGGYVSQTRDAEWDEGITKGTIDDLFAAEPEYTTANHVHYRLVLSVLDSEGNEVSTVPKAAVNIDYRNPPVLKIADDMSDTYTGTSGNSVNANESHYFYQVKDGGEPGYTKPVWTVLPVVNGQVQRSVKISVNPTTQEWEYNDDTYEDHGYIDESMIREAVEAYDPENATSYAETCDTYLLRLQLANDSNEVYTADADDLSAGAVDTTELTVTFTDWFPEVAEPEYVLRVYTEVDGQKRYFEEGVYYYASSADGFNMDLHAELYCDDELVEENLQYEWFLQSSQHVEDEYKDSSTDATYNMYGHLSQHEDLLDGAGGSVIWALYSEARDESGNFAYVNLAFVITHELQITYPTEEVSEDAYANDPYTMQVEVINGDGASYQWQKQGSEGWENGVVDVPGANGAELTLESLTYEDTGIYRCVVSKDETTLYSKNFYLYVHAKVELSQSYDADQDVATLTAAVEPVDGYTYEYVWFGPDGMINEDNEYYPEPSLTVENPVDGAEYTCDVFIAPETGIQRQIVSQDNRITLNLSAGGDAEPEYGITVYVNGTAYSHGDTVNLAPGETAAITAEATGTIAGYALTFELDGEVQAGDNLDLSFDAEGNHTLKVTASNASAFTLRSAPEANDDGSYSATITLAVNENTGSGGTEGGEGDDPIVDPGSGNSTILDLHPETEEIPHIKEGIEVTGIQDDEDPKPSEIIYYVELVWGDMEFTWHQPATYELEWQTGNHTYSKEDETANGWWEHSTAEIKGNLGECDITGEQNAVLVFNHSNAAVESKIEIADKGVAGINASISGEDEKQLARGAVSQIYTKEAAAKVEVSLSDPSNYQDILNRQTVASITVTLSPVDAEATVDEESVELFKQANAGNGSENEPADDPVVDPTNP